MRVSIAVAASIALAASSAQGDPLRARLDFSDEYLRFPDRIREAGPPRWLPGDQNRLVYWSDVGPGRGTWVLVDARRRTSEPLLSSRSLRAQLARLAGKKVELPRQLRFAVDPDRGLLSFRIDGRAFALRLSDRRVVTLAPTDLAALSLSPGSALSPDRRVIAVPRGAGFAILDRIGHALVERKGEEHREWQVPRATWSPDGRFAALWRNDARGAHKIPIVDYASAIERVSMVPYTKVGTPLERPELHFVELASRRVTSAPVPAYTGKRTAERESYQWLAGWRPDSSEALVLRLSRDGKRLDLLAVAPATGRVRLVLREERPQTFVAALDFALWGWADQVTPLGDNRRFLWMSERDGWRHVYQYDYSGRLLGQVTKGAFPVHEVVGFLPGNAILLLASAERAAPYDRLVYRASLSGGELERLSADAGVHEVLLAPSGKSYADGHSTRARPQTWSVAPTSGGTPFRYATADVSALTVLHHAPPEPFTALAADGKTRLYGVLYTPWDLDRRKRYPVIDCIYAGPFVSVVPWTFVGTTEGLIAGSLAQMGFVVMVLDARGTPGRGKAFQDANYGRVGQTEVPEHVAALRQAAATRPYMDLTRAGIYGHSWGGYFALRGMLTAPEFFTAGYAAAPGALEEEAIINEPNLGLPGDNPAGYAAGTNVDLAGKLRGALKLMHGTSDVSASLSTTMRMAAALIRTGKRFDLLIMPGEGHAPTARRYYLDDVRRFFVDQLGAPR